MFQVPSQVKTISCSVAYSITHIFPVSGIIHDLIPQSFKRKRNCGEKGKQRWMLRGTFSRNEMSKRLEPDRKRVVKRKKRYLHGCVWCWCLFIAPLSSLNEFLSFCPKPCLSLAWPSTSIQISGCIVAKRFVSGFTAIYLIFVFCFLRLSHSLLLPASVWLMNSFNLS